MSWWIMDFVSINEDGTEGICEIECDTAAGLPAADQTLTAGITIVRGSKALDLSTGNRYKMDSSGSWVQQPSEYSLDLSGYATQSWVSGELAGYVQTTTYTTDQAAQDAAILSETEARQAECGDIANLGAKNLLEITGTSQTVRDVIITVGADGTVTTSGTASAASNAFIFGTFTPKKSGTYTVTSGSSSAAATVYNVQIREGTSSTGTIIDRVYNDPVTVTLTQGITYAIRLYFNTGVSVADTFKVMIRPSAITDNTYVPYAPTNRELYEMILAL